MESFREFLRAMYAANHYQRELAFIQTAQQYNMDVSSVLVSQSMQEAINTTRAQLAAAESRMKITLRDCIREVAQIKDASDDV